MRSERSHSLIALSRLDEIAVEITDGGFRLVIFTTSLSVIAVTSRTLRCFPARYSD